jgi:DNA polymerase III gamma/tau subunit
MNEHGALHIKHRPKDLDGIVGNEATVRSLRAIIERKPSDRPRAYLFYGPKGCGKTTMARIVAAEFGAIGMDLSEIDVADFRGIETARKIRERMNYKPMEGSVRAYLLDECHMLTTEAQTALLKALEDTPEHVCFLLCTTEPNKLKGTVRDRCHKAEVRTIPEEDLDQLLRDVAKAEDKAVSRKAREKIASMCEGSPRAALTMLDAVIDLPRREQAESVKAIEDAEKQAIDLCRAIANKRPWTEIKEIIAGLRKTTGAEEARRAIMGYFTSAMLGKGSDKSAYLFLDAFRETTYDNGWAEIVMAAWELMQGGDIEPF